MRAAETGERRVESGVRERRTEDRGRAFECRVKSGEWRMGGRDRRGESGEWGAEGGCPLGERQRRGLIPACGQRPRNGIEKRGEDGCRTFNFERPTSKWKGVPNNACGIF